MLSDRQIKHALRWRGLNISGFNTPQLQPASYDVRLHNDLLVLRAGDPLDPKVDSTGEWEPVTMDEDGFVLEYRMFALGSTKETVSMGEALLGQVEGKSSLGRLGLMVHVTAGYLDPGFEGQITLELSCVHPRGIRLYPGMTIAQIGLDDACAVEHLYQGKYTGQVGPTASRYHQNWTGERWR